MSNPKIYLIARPKIDVGEVEKFLKDRNLQWARSEKASSAEELVEIGGRVCYLSFRGEPSKMRYPNAAYIHNLVDQGHDSVLEHASWTFLIDRVSRAFTHQLVRHRAGLSFSQLSQQYHDESGTEFVPPADLDQEPELRGVWQETVESTREAYHRLLSALAKGISPDDKEALRRVRSTARSLLPNATETSLVLTANARALRHFFRTRGAILGDIEMRQAAYAIFKLVRADSPALFEDFEAGIASDDRWPAVQSKTDARKKLSLLEE